MFENANGLHAKFTYGQKSGVLSFTPKEIVARFSVSVSSVEISWNDVLGVRLVAPAGKAGDHSGGIGTSPQPASHSWPSNLQHVGIDVDVEKGANEGSLRDDVDDPGMLPEVDKSRTLILCPFLPSPRDLAASYGSGSGSEFPVHHLQTSTNVACPGATESVLHPPSATSTLTPSSVPCPDGDPSCPMYSLDVYYVYRKACSEWVVARLSLRHASTHVLRQLKSVVRNKLAELKHRPSSALVFINPYGGKRAAVRIFEKKVEPIFRLAGMKIHVIVTTRQNHAYDFLAANDYSTYGAVVGVGGDGLISELVNGMWARVSRPSSASASCLRRSRRDGGDVDVVVDDERGGGTEEIDGNPAFPVALGIIPGGSTNTLDYSLNGRSLPVNAAINIALGRRLKMDVMAVFQNNELLKLCVNAIFYGFLGDMMQRSEKLRFLGPPRYNVSGVQTFLGNSTKDVECEYRGCAPAETSPKCRRQCSKCGDASADAAVDESSEDWKSVSGKFSQVGCLVHSVYSVYSPGGVSPGAHIGDGYLDVLSVRDSSKFNFLRFLFMTRFFPEKKFDLPFVTLLRVKELRIKPLNNAGDFYNCDGELLPAGPVHCKVMRQMLEVFSHGNDLGPLTTSSSSSSCEIGAAAASEPRRGLSFFSKLTSQFRNKKNKADFRRRLPTSSSAPGIDLIFTCKRGQQEFSCVNRELSSHESSF